ncbi:glycosyltransferase family 92 domain-containing protein [Ditylenchus destructor]|nr:glycosyltransferase family 92 domain-containing protein [Ditylenchus destructor]
MWSSRKALLLNAFGLSLFILSIRLSSRVEMPDQDGDLKPFLDSNPLSEPFFGAVNDAAQAIRYLYDMQKGRAEVLPVVESPKALVSKPNSCGFFRIWRKSWAEPKFLARDQNSGSTFVKNGEIYLYSAYLDGRRNSLFPEAKFSIQVLVSTFGELSNRSGAYLCHIYRRESNGLEKMVVEAHIRIIWQKAWDPRTSFYNAFLITCPIPNHLHRDSSTYHISISRSLCPKESLNAIPVQTQADPEKRIRIGVCVKGLDFLDEKELSARRLVEWIELNLVLGAESVTFYSYYVPGRLRRVLNDYEAKGKVHLKRRNELIPYNDCFYRYVTSGHNFVLIVDTDEIVVPLKHSNWQEMLQETLPSIRAEPSAISVRNVYKFASGDKRDKSHSLLDHTTRSATIQDREQYGKSFVSTSSIGSVFNHFALHRLHANVSRTVYLDENVALKLHFKSRCPAEELGIKACEDLKNNLVKDNSLGRFAETVRKRVTSIMQQLGEN